MIKKAMKEVANKDRELCSTENLSQPDTDILQGLNLTQDQAEAVKAIALAAGVYCRRKLLSHKIGDEAASIIGLFGSMQSLRNIDAQSRTKATPGTNTRLSGSRCTSDEEAKA